MSRSDVTAPSSRKSRGPIGRAYNLDDAAQVHAKLVRVAARCLFRELLQDGLQLRVGCGRRHARPDLEVHAEVDVGLEPDSERHVDVRFAPTKARRHHADDLIVLANQLDRAADHGRIACVVALPELIAKHHHARRILTRRRIGRDEPSAHERWNTPMIRCVGRDVGRGDVLGDIAISGRQVPSVFADDALDGSGLSKLVQLRARHARISETAGIVSEGELHHSIGAHVGEGIDQDAVHDAEHSAGGADAEGEGEDGGEREAWAAAQFPRRVSKVGDDRTHIIAFDEYRTVGVGV